MDFIITQDRAEELFSTLHKLGCETNGFSDFDRETEIILDTITKELDVYLSETTFW